MAITNAQQYQQLVNKPADGKRPGYRGVGGYRGGPGGSGGKGGREAPGSKGGSPSERDFSTGPNVGRDPNEKPAQQIIGGESYPVTPETRDKRDMLFELENERKRKEQEDFITAPANYSKYTPGYLKFLANLNRQPNRKYLVNEVLKGKNASRIITDALGLDEDGLAFAPDQLTASQLEQVMDTYMADRMSGQTDAMGNINPSFGRDDGGGDGGMSDYEKRLLELEKQNAALQKQAAAATPTTTQNPFAYRFMADGGSTGGIMDADIVGGMMDGNMDEMGRQMYGLGKLVKKATRAVKKVAKSPIGKAALLYGLGAMGGSFGAGKGLFSKGMFNPGNMMRGLFGANSIMMNKAGLGSQAAMKGLFGKLGLTGGYGGLMPTLKGGLALASLAPLVFQGDEEEENFDPYRGPDIDIDKIRSDPYGAMGGAYRFAADGGIMRSAYQEGGDAEPVAKKTMPLIDMDGKEKDYRETGGFVDMGRMERADDVPARLSKNEFVFTADAVRNAGEGDIDKGAEVMYNMMKNLEAGGEVSEESQGLEGARNMFQTSQRLGEVI